MRRDDLTMAVNIFDLSGDDDFKEVRKDFFKDAIGVVMVFDVNIKVTFDNLARWELEAKTCGLDLSKSNVIVVGNKNDKKKTVVD